MTHSLLWYSRHAGSIDTLGTLQNFGSLCPIDTLESFDSLALLGTLRLRRFAHIIWYTRNH